jgi:hypothetical protein
VADGGRSAAVGRGACVVGDMAVGGASVWGAVVGGGVWVAENMAVAVGVGVCVPGSSPQEIVLKMKMAATRRPAILRFMSIKSLLSSVRCYVSSIGGDIGEGVGVLYALGVGVGGTVALGVGVSEPYALGVGVGAKMS